MPVLRDTLRVARGACVPCALWLLACGPSPIHVNGVMRESSEMRPLRNLPQGAYSQLRVLVRSGSESGETPECGSTPLEGSEDHNNAACVPSDASNAAVKLVRQRLRSYGLNLVREAREPHDYDVHVLVVGVAPKKPDPMLARAATRVTFRHVAEAQGSPGGGFFATIDEKAAGEAFDAVAKDCALQDSDLADFSASAVQPMNPDFDVVALTSDAVDNLVGCAELARFFLDAKNRFPRAASAPPAAPAAPAAPAEAAPPK
jgi:hypothetical protein